MNKKVEELVNMPREVLHTSLEEEALRYSILGRLFQILISFPTEERIEDYGEWNEDGF